MDATQWAWGHIFWLSFDIAADCVNLTLNLIFFPVCWVHSETHGRDEIQAWSLHGRTIHGLSLSPSKCDWIFLLLADPFEFHVFLLRSASTLDNANYCWREKKFTGMIMCVEILIKQSSIKIMEYSVKKRNHSLSLFIKMCHIHFYLRYIVT